MLMATMRGTTLNTILPKTTQAHTGGIMIMIKFLLALVQYIIGLASLIVWLVVSVAEVICAILALALIAHMTNCFIN